MPMFAYVVKDANGKTKKDLGESLNEQILIERLQNEGYFIVSVASASIKAPAHENKRIVKVRQFTHNAVKIDDLLVFARQLATMLDSGITLMRSLVVIADQIDSKKLHQMVKSSLSNVEQGKTLSSSLAKYPKTFRNFG